MPFNIWCNQCGAMIAKGVRFNASKKCVGSYFSTKIYRFRMKCANCPDTIRNPNYIEIETDPEHCDYRIISGARRKEEKWEDNEKDSKTTIFERPKDPELQYQTEPEEKQSRAEEMETISLYDEDTRRRFHEDPMFQLEQKQIDKEKGAKVNSTLIKLQKESLSVGDVYKLNRMLRDKLRSERKRDKDLKREGKRIGLSVPLLPYDKKDDEELKNVSASFPLFFSQYLDNFVLNYFCLIFKRIFEKSKLILLDSHRQFFLFLFFLLLRIYHQQPYQYSYITHLTLFIRLTI